MSQTPGEDTHIIYSEDAVMVVAFNADPAEAISTALPSSMVIKLELNGFLPEDFNTRFAEKTLPRNDVDLAAAEDVQHLVACIPIAAIPRLIASLQRAYHAGMTIVGERG